MLNFDAFRESSMQVLHRPRGAIRFGPFELDLGAGELRKHGLKTRLQQQPFRVLALLLEHPGEVVTREELRQAIWPADTFVDFDEGLDATIYKLRNTLGDSSENPRFVETLPRRGYRFIAPVEEVRPKTIRARDPLTMAGVLTAAVLALLFGLNFAGTRDRLLGRTNNRRIRSLVVLPLQNLSGDPSQEYFADGMTEALTTDLGKIGALRVISRTSAMQYKGTHKNMSEIAKELNVDAAVEGAVLRSGERVRITTQLVETSSDRHLWAETYERDLRDVLRLQDELALTIAKQVQVKVSADEQTRLATAYSVDTEALEAYLEGREEWNNWTEESSKKSIKYFEQAVDKNPGYATAWAGISDAYMLLHIFGARSQTFSSRQEAFQKAKTAALKALELDPSLSEAHVSVASALLFQWADAEKELQRAIALNPSNAMAHQWYGYLLSALGRFDEAIAEMKRALELDPLSSNKQNSLAATFYRAGRYDEALEHFREVPEADVNSAYRHHRMAAIYERKGMQKEAVAEIVTALRIKHQNELAAVVQSKFVSSGYSSAKETFLWGDLQENQRQAKDGLLPLAVTIAGDYALLGQTKKAFEWLEKAFREREHGLMYLKVDDRFEALRSDPRFQSLVHLIGLG
jgi:TolB-like protein/DNA-binding winged helix-turn-helix (wHTH) protein/Flp pilus assembly protein TadD